MQAAAPVRPSMTSALRVLEGVLLRGGHRTARQNAWTAVLEDRQRARARTEAETFLQSEVAAIPHIPSALD